MDAAVAAAAAATAAIATIVTAFRQQQLIYEKKKFLFTRQNDMYFPLWSSSTPHLSKEKREGRRVVQTISHVLRCIPRSSLPTAWHTIKQDARACHKCASLVGFGKCTTGPPDFAVWTD